MGRKESDAMELLRAPAATLDCKLSNLGAGYRSSSGREVPNVPLQIDEGDVISMPATLNFFNVYLIASQADVKRFESMAFSVDASGSLYGFGGSGDFRREASRSFAFSDTSISLVIALDAIVHICNLKTSHLSPTASQTSAAATVEDFFANYGDAFVKTRSYGKSLYLILNIEIESAAFRQRLLSSYSVGGSYLNLFSASSDGGWTSIRQELVRKCRVELKMTSAGIDASAIKTGIPVLGTLNRDDAYDSLDVLFKQAFSFAAAFPSADGTPSPIALESEPAPTATGFKARNEFSKLIIRQFEKYRDLDSLRLHVEAAIQAWGEYFRRKSFFKKELKPDAELRKLVADLADNHSKIVEALKLLEQMPWAEPSVPPVEPVFPTRESVDDLVTRAFETLESKVYFGFFESPEFPAARLKALKLVPKTNYFCWISSSNGKTTYNLQAGTAKPQSKPWNKSSPAIIQAGAGWQNFPSNSDGFLLLAGFPIGYVSAVEFKY
jgi:hypothetical protein